MSRYAVSRAIESLDPVTDHQKIVYLVGAYEFPFETQRSLELALFRTFAVPSISALTDTTGEFTRAGQKRYDDTALIVAEIAENGYDSERGRAAIRRMNQMHRRYSIPNDEFLYVLSTFVFEPIRWNALLAWRESTRTEKLANFYFWREVGRRMGIKGIPETYEAFEAFNRDYERKHFRYADSNRRVAESTVRVFLGWFPPILHPIVRRAIYALLDDPLREAFGFPKQPAWFVTALKKLLRLRAHLVKLLPPRRTPYLYTRLKNPTYPQGYRIDELGPADTTR